MRRTRTSHALACLALLSIGAAAGGDAAADVAIFTFSVDGGEKSSVEIKPGPDPTGQVAYTTTVELEDLILNVYCIANLVPGGTSVVNNTFTILNLGAEPRTVLCHVVVALPETLYSNVLVGGVSSMRLTTDADGGELTCAPGSTAAIGLVKQQGVVHQLFYCPFQLAISGQGTIVSNTFFGLPIPSLPVAGPISLVGQSTGITITPGDTATSKLAFGIKGNPIPLP
ncbi:MAG TPA: hypothetical protein PKC43_07830 [Phycisphaerales bacterium]|nr:hypothetical protein [Phycisphaerales bacterium]HMP37346.1 hypothetical protein [Phycisphaerales bacterium]